MAQIGDRRLSRWQGVVGEAVTEVGEGEIELLCQLPAGGQRAGEIGEQAPHLSGRLEVALALSGEEAARIVDRHVGANRSHDVVQWLVGGLGITHAVGRQERQAELPSHIDQSPVTVLLVAQPMALQLDA